MLAATMNQAIVLLYTRTDFDLLLSSPLPARAVLLGRLASVALTAFLSIGVFVAPMLDGAMIRFSPRYAGGYVVFALLAVLAASLGVALTLFLVRWFGPARARLVAMVLAAVLSASLSLVSLVPMLVSKAKFVELQRAFVHAAQHPAFAAVADANRGAPLPLAALALVVAGAVALTVRLLARTFVSGLQATNIALARRRRSAHRWTEGLTLAGMRKDFRLIARSPMLVMQLLPVTLMLAPASLIFFKLAGFRCLPPVALFIAAMLSFSFAEVASAGEVGWDLVRLSPASEPRLRRIKMAACMALPLALAAALSVWVAVAGRPGMALVTLVTSAVCAAGCAWVGVVTIKPSPRYDLVQAPNPSYDLRSLYMMVILFPGATGLALVSFDHYALGIPFVGATLLCVLGCFTLLEPRPAEALAG